MHTMYVIQFIDRSFARNHPQYGWVYFARNHPQYGWVYTEHLSDAAQFLLREDAEEIYRTRYDYPGDVVEVSVSNGGRFVRFVDR